MPNILRNEKNKINDMNEDIARNLVRMRESSHLPIDQMAGYLDVNKTDYEKYENASENVSIDILQKVSALFGYPLNYFFENNLIPSNGSKLNEFSVDDLHEIARFNSIVMNYMKMVRLEDES